MNVNKFDLIILGGGSAAFAAAIQANSLKINTLMINEGLPLGGTCVNVGCVPSKFLIRVAASIHRASISNFKGVSPKGSVLDYTEIVKQNKTLVDEMRQGKYVDLLSGLPYLSVLKGRGRFRDKKVIEVNGELYEGSRIIIATGASTLVPEIDGIYDVGYLTSESLFELEKQPQSLVILGAGYIALEIAQAYQRMGTKVTLIQRSKSILSKEAKDITDELQKHLTSEGLTIHTGATLERIWKEGEEIKVSYHLNGISETIASSHILLATGSKGNTKDLGLEKPGIETNESGLIPTDEFLRTSAKDVFAVGDVTTNPPFVYTAAYEGSMAVRNAFQPEATKADFSVLPWVVFTDPQVAGVGIDEREAAKNGLPHQVRIFHLRDIPRSIVALGTKGFIKLIRNPENDLLLGARIIAPEGGELLMQLSMIIKYKIPLREVISMFHPYLTLSEGIKLAAMSFTTDVKKMSCCAS